jgi:hypothetical protein
MSAAESWRWATTLWPWNMPPFHVRLPGPGDKGLARTLEPSPAEQLRKRVGRVWLENSGGLPRAASSAFRRDGTNGRRPTRE